MDKLEEQKPSKILFHVLWIGGATDAGKTTIAQILAARHGFETYHHDRHDARHVAHLAETLPRYRAFLDASLEERWIVPEPEDLLQFALQSFQDRFPLLIHDLLARSQAPPIVAEGFGLTPELLYPLLSSVYQAIWLVPSEGFKRASMVRRNKPSFMDMVVDPERAMRNVFIRDMLLAEQLRRQAEPHGLRVCEVDGTRSMEEMVVMVERHFEPFLSHWDSLECDQQS